MVCLIPATLISDDILLGPYSGSPPPPTQRWEGERGLKIFLESHSVSSWGA